MKQYIARQPIFNVHKKLYAYELLYRGVAPRSLEEVGGNQATASLLSSTFLTRDIEEISSHKPCFINFTQDLLERDLPAMFPKSSIVVEILEDVNPTQKVLENCRRLHDRGYKIALDDFVYDRKFEPLIELAAIVKIDVRLTPLDTLMRTLNLLSRHKVKLLAEKVETLDEFDKANKLGFSYFQGYFFCKPEPIEIKEISVIKVNLLRLLAEVTRKDTTIERLKEIISEDIAITYKLLRFLNSSYFYLLEEVKSVEHAIAYLGEKELRRFVMLVIISELTTEKPGELVRLALVRAKFCELLGKASPYRNEASQLFIVGLFSLLDAMLDVTMKEVMGMLPISDKVKDAFLERKGVYAGFLHIAIASERNQVKALKPLFTKLQIDLSQVRESYVTAVKYANGHG